MTLSLEHRLEGLTTMSSAQLRAEWLNIYRKPPPDLSADLLRRGIAYRLQERAYGGLSPATMKQIERLKRQFAKTGEAVAKPAFTLKPGTRLVRDWGRKSHHVLVLGDGYLYNDRSYRSLSQIASEITGAHWSGPRFFGLAKQSEKADA
jgi:hypothetical protein